MMSEVESSKKIGCKEDGEKAYRCDVELELSQGGATQKAPANLRFVKGSEGWMVQRRRAQGRSVPGVLVHAVASDKLTGA